ncbi:MAG TPA: hypothetical protein VHC39_11845 [Rhizomicrobium sp.]|nr:hypothetical protein [Rhizomicrobium sp.]
MGWGSVKNQQITSGLAQNYALYWLTALWQLGNLFKAMFARSWPLANSDRTTSWEITFKDSPVQLLDGSYGTGPVWYRRVNGELQFSLMTDDKEYDLWERDQW